MTFTIAREGAVCLIHCDYCTKDRPVATYKALRWFLMQHEDCPTDTVVDGVKVPEQRAW